MNFIHNSILNSFNDSSYKKLLRSKKTIQAVAVFTNSDPELLWKKVNCLENYISNAILNNGIRTVCSRIKDAERSYLLGTSYGWVSLRRYFSGNGISSNATKVLLSIHRNMSGPLDLSVKTIQHKPIDDLQEIISKYENHIKKICSMDQFTLTPYGEEFAKTNKYWSRSFKKNEHNPYTADITIDSNGRTGGHDAPLCVSHKGRANGSCLVSQEGDLCALRKYPKLTDAISRVWSEWLYNFDLYQYPGCTGSCSHVVSRLEALKDKSCKTRVVAIFDTYSQAALRPFHKMMEELLEKLHKSKVDFTFNHLFGVQRLKNKFGNSMMYSVDISAATDTIPFELSKKIISFIINPMIVRDPSTFVEDISTILTKRPFTYNGEEYHYASGQPMGAYGSFPLLALTNHLLVQLAHQLATGKSFFFSRYAIVGDDVVIASDIVAKRYILLLEEFGIPVNLRKTITGIGTFEFCRRIVQSGSLCSVPSWNAHFEAVIRNDPTPLLCLYRDYGMDLPNYRSLQRLFKTKFLRTTLAFHSGIVIPDGPQVTRIDDGIKTHAERCLVIGEALNRGEPQEIQTDDPYLKRLNYCKTIFALFNQKKLRPKVIGIQLLDGTKLPATKVNDIPKLTQQGKCPKILMSKGVSLWDKAWMCKANTFYLGYIRTYLESKRLMRITYAKRSEVGRSLKIRHFCMTHWKKWNTAKLRSHFVTSGS